MALYDYRWYFGHDVVLGTLRNVEDDLRPYVGLRIIAPTSQPVDPFPVETELMNGSVRGDGQVNHQWRFPVLPIAALDYILDTYLTVSAALVKSRAMTIYTRRHDRLTYERYNCYLVLPKPGQDYTYDRRHVRELVLRFTNLTTPG